MNGTSAELIARWETGDQLAADSLFQRYAERLIALVRAHLSEKLARRLDPEDVVQSAYKSFFIGVRDGRFLLRAGGDLWRLLVAIALHKLRHQVERHTAGKRTVGREISFDQAADQLRVQTAMLARDPSPADAIALADELERLMADLTPLECRMFELRLEGYTLDEIAADCHRSQRTVRRLMDRIKAKLENRFGKHVSS